MRAARLAGELSAFYVGGCGSKWEYFVAGEPIEQMSDAAEEATSGELVFVSVSRVSGPLSLSSSHTRLTNFGDSSHFGLTQDKSVSQSSHELQ